MHRIVARPEVEPNGLLPHPIDRHEVAAIFPHLPDCELGLTGCERGIVNVGHPSLYTIDEVLAGQILCVYEQSR